jgi:2,4-dienoyl-CoA reductase-like NADH-dependent reductase (Old Yellow Enzyme family)
MAPHQQFRFKTLEDLQAKIQDLGLNIPISNNISILEKKLPIMGIVVPNRIVVHPMEGCDGRKDGSPGPLTERRYERFGKSGAGLIWYEATAISAESRANPRQLMLTETNKNNFISLIQKFRNEEEKFLDKHQALGKAVLILQITHSGRYSRPEEKLPQRMYFFDPLDKAYHQTRENGRILSDDELDQLPELYEQSVKLAKEIGFDGVDIKSCHRYLLNESFSAFTRENSKYGGESFENRTRLLSNIIDRIGPKFGGNKFLISSRLNIYDGIPYPYGFGVQKESFPDIENYTGNSSSPKEDLSEPIKLLNILYDKGMRLVNLTMGNPYFNPQVSRPFDQAPAGASIPNEHPLEGVARFLTISQAVKKGIPVDMKTIGTGYTWLRQYGINVAAAEIDAGAIDMVGWGRMAFANPEFGRQIFLEGKINQKKTCIACSKCTELMRKKTVTGCVIRDSEIYRPYFSGDKQPDWD